MVNRVTGGGSSLQLPDHIVPVQLDADRPLAGTTKVATILQCVHRGSRDQEPACGPAVMHSRFVRGLVVNGIEFPGAPLTPAQVDARIEQVALRESDETPADFPTIPTGVSDGFFTLPIPFPATYSLTNKESGTIQLVVKLKSTAANSTVQRFYGEHYPEGSPWHVLSANLVSSP